MGKRPHLRALDLFCCQGGVSRGLVNAGFKVEGVDILPQHRYPYKFHQADALDFPLDGFDFVWASPPCQKFTRMNRGLLQSQCRAKDHPDLIEPMRAKLKAWGGPWIMENVPGAPLLDPAQVYGSAFGLDVQRHRIFESNCMLLGTACHHGRYRRDKPSLHRNCGNGSRVVGCYGNGRGKGDNIALWSSAMRIDWMTRKGLAQAIPPDYSEYLGRQVMRIIQGSFSTQ